MNPEPAMELVAGNGAHTVKIGGEFGGTYPN
jgi:hypothetical protein